MGMNKVNISKLYSVIYDTATRIITPLNPCNIHIESNEVRCVCGEVCCKGCEYLSKKGCVVKCLGCKFGFCPKGYEKSYKIRFVHKLLTPLALLANHYNMLFIRASKKEFMNKDDSLCRLKYGVAVQYK